MNDLLIESFRIYCFVENKKKLKYQYFTQKTTTAKISYYFNRTHASAVNLGEFKKKVVKLAF